MFLDLAPAYFEYIAKVLFRGLPSVLCKILGVFQVGYHNKVTGKKVCVVSARITFSDNIDVIFYTLSCIFFICVRFEREAPFASTTDSTSLHFTST